MLRPSSGVSTAARHVAVQQQDMWQYSSRTRGSTAAKHVAAQLVWVTLWIVTYHKQEVSHLAVGLHARAQLFFWLSATPC